MDLVHKGRHLRLILWLFWLRLSYLNFNYNCYYFSVSLNKEFKLWHAPQTKVEQIVQKFCKLKLFCWNFTCSTYVPAWYYYFMPLMCMTCILIHHWLFQIQSHHHVQISCPVYKFSGFDALFFTLHALYIHTEGVQFRDSSWFLKQFCNKADYEFLWN
jgi:hypothetical protein